MDSKDSKINKAVAAQLRGARGQAEMTYEELAAESGMPLSTLRRVLKGHQDVAVADLVVLAGALGKEASALYEQATKDAGGEDAAYADVRAIFMDKRQARLASVSEGSDTTDELAERRRKQEEAARMTVEELEREPGAATRDAELDSDEPDVP